MLLASFSPLYAQPITITPGYYQVDNALKLIICNRIPGVPSTPQSVTLVFDKNYTLAGTGEALQVGKEYALGSSNGNYKLYFTNFSIIALNTNSVAISDDENRTKGTVTVADPAAPLFTASMGIRIRGNTSRMHPKKSYNMELWKDTEGKEELETSLLGMREDSKWFFKAMYNEPLRANNMTAWKIWIKMHQLYYKSQEPDALPGIRNRYCDVFINNAYNGVHMLTEDLDRKQLKLKKTKDNGEIRGELYKSGYGSDASAYSSVFNQNELLPFNNNSEVWAGYEMDYPKEPYWNRLFDLTSFVVKSSDADFKSQIGSKFRLDNLIDYFLFLNAIGGVDDNFGNNQFVVRYKENEPYIYVPWDLDVTMGNQEGTTDNIVERIGTNGLFYRLLTTNPNGFKSRMRKRWFALRQSDWTTANFRKNLTDNVTALTNDGAYKREGLRWAGSFNTNELNPVLTWIEKRLAFLDQYFSEFPAEDPSAVEISLLNFTAQVSGSEKLLQWTTRFEKNANRFEIEYSADGVAFSKVGQVTATGNSSTETSYQFTHANAAAVAYYRLKIFNNDELANYGPTVLVGACPGPPAIPTVSASVTAINAGQSQLLKATGCAHTVVWNTGQVGSQITVTPAVTTSYQALCRQGAGCESAFSNSLTIQVNQQTAYDGYLNTVSCGTISGWAWDGKKPNTSLMVEILDGQKVVAMVPATIYRPELKTAGKGNGFHAYAFSTPKSLQDNKAHIISARVQGSSFILKQSSRSLTCPPVQNLPKAPPIGPLAATVNTEFNWALPMFYDEDFGTLFYGLTGLPDGLSFNLIGREISGIPTATGTYNLVYTANDGQSSVSTPVTLVVGSNTPQSTNQPPVAPVVTPLSATVNAGFSASLPAFTDTDPLTYELKGLPAGLQFSNRQISGSPTESGSFSLTYTASDGQATTPVLIALTVADAQTPPPGNQPPIAPVVTPLSATVNTGFSATLPAFTDTDPLTYTLTGLPNGLQFGNRQITGTPTVSGSFSLTYTATDTQAASTSLVLALTVQSVSPPVTVTGNFEGYLDKVECGTIRGWAWDRNKPNTPLLLEFFANGVSIGTTLADIYRQDLKDAGKGNGAHAYSFMTPSSVKTGVSIQLSAKVKDSDYLLKGSPKALNCPSEGTPSNVAPVAPAVSPLSATVNVGFSASLPAFTDADPLTYTLSGLPAGLQFSNRQITGTPTVSGSFSLTYTATDPQGASAFVLVGLSISPLGSGSTPVTVTGNFEGYLDKVECSSIRGWVWDRNKPNAALSVEFFANGVSIGTAMADQFRQDLKDAGKGNGAHVYTFVTPGSVKTGQTYKISAKVQNSSYTLNWSPKDLTCPSGSRLSGESGDAETVAGLQIWPNPSTGRFEVEYRLSAGRPGTLSVVDGSGRSWYRQEVSGGGTQRQTIDLTGTRGGFFIQLRQGKSVQSKKILLTP
ncbi:CotH kinase family protein [Larkinella bovis]|uniref:CotH kinase family protein n=1 Tax=Larkinella bovis TaxID=683041 RepID=A0ABW0I384_9BACT